MIEIILIVVLTILVIVLAIIAFTGAGKKGSAVQLNETAVNDLLAAVGSISGEGRIPEVAASVSNILKKHLHCDKIIFLRYYRSNLEVNYFSGVTNFSKHSLRIKLKPSLMESLKSFHRVTPIGQLESALSKGYLKQLEALHLSYFFPVFLRDRLYGIYLISTKLPPDNPTLNLLATTLAFNLSTAYHIGLQEQKIARYESKIHSLEERKFGAPAGDQAADSALETLRLLKIRNSQQLVPELLKLLRKDCNFSKLGLYLKSGGQDSPMLSVSWNMSKEADKIIEENFETIVKKMEMDKPVNLKMQKEIDQVLESSFKDLNGKSVNYMMSIPWAYRRKAVLAWSSDSRNSEVLERIERFKKEALPLAENISRYERAEELSYTDGLTGIYNFRYFKKRINEEVKRAKRFNHHLALMLFDVDDLKFINDKYGHQAGDELIKSFAGMLQEAVRENDVLSRYGGDEFCLLMPETNRAETLQFMERIGKRLSSSGAFIEWTELRLDYTVSIGGAVYPDDSGSVEELIHAADMALLRAKEEGRNCARLYQPEYERKA